MTDPNLRQNDEFCVWEQEEGGYSVGLVGTGPGFGSILEIIANQQYHDFLPPLTLVAVAEPGQELYRIERARKLGVPLYDTMGAMLAAHPGIDLVVELVGKANRLREIRHDLPAHVSLIDHKGAFFLCGLHSMLQAGTYCRVNLNRQKELLQAIIDEVREDILLLDKECRVVDMNRNVQQRTGKSKEELVGQHCWEVQRMDPGVPFCDGPDAKCPFFQTVQTRQKAEAMLTRVNAEGELQYFRIYAYPISDERGELSHVLVMRRDITARTQRERLQHQREKMAVIGEMSTFLAHEIRNPLFAIGGFTNALLRSPNLSDKEREKVVIIAEETKRLDHMLTSILNFSRPAKQVQEEVDLNKVAVEALDLMQLGYARQGIVFRLEQGEHVPQILGDPEMIKQSLVNIIKNSVEALTGDGTVTVRTGLSEGLAFVRVEDTGIGMSQAQLEKVFSPFYTTKATGYGLGLAVIKKMMEDLGGHVELKSKEGAGTTVTLYFPPVLADKTTTVIDIGPAL